jgi:hypothetical protein
MRYLLVLGFSLTCVLASKAQSDFRNGYIIKNDNDTLHGLIDYRGVKSNARKCVFKKDPNSESHVFTPGELTGFQFMNSKYYVSKFINAGSAPEQLFVECLIKGIVGIYYYRDFDGEHYLIEDKDGRLYELKNDKREVVVGDSKYYKESKEYVGVLKAVLKDSPTTSRRVESMDLNHKSLVNIVHDYHNEVCRDQDCLSYTTKLPRSKSRLGVVVGLNRLSISETGEFSDDFFYLKNSRFESRIYPSIGIFYKVNMPFIDERLHFQYEGTYSRASLTTTNSVIEPLYNLNYINDIRLVQSAFNNVGFFKYEFPGGQLRPTFQVGAFMKYIFSTNYQRNQEVKIPSGDTFSTSSSVDNPFSKFDYGLNLGVGLTSFYLNGKELFLDIRYQRGFGIIESLNSNAFSANLGLQIGR